MVTIKESRMEVLFGLFGVIFLAIMILVTYILTPGFSLLEDAISHLGNSNANSLFSIGFVVGGSLLIPFYIYLKNELVYLNNRLRKIATGIAIFSNMCIALVGILPDPNNQTAFDTFHSFVAIVGFVGSSVYIVLYSVLMYLGPQSTMYKGPTFKKYLAYYGFFIGVILVAFMVYFVINPLFLLLEWILTILMLGWMLITAVQSLSFKFSKIPGIYYKQSQYPEKMKLFKDAIQVLKNLEMEDDPIMETLKENIEFIESEMEKNQEKSNHT